MNRLILAALAIALIASAGRSDSKTTVRVTGTVTLPKGEKLLPGAKVTVKVLFFRPSGMITFYSTIGSHEITLADPNKPIAFSVGIPNSYAEKYAPDRFLMRAIISVMDGNRSKTIFHRGRRRGHADRLGRKTESKREDTSNEGEQVTAERLVRAPAK